MLMCSFLQLYGDIIFTNCYFSSIPVRLPASRLPTFQFQSANVTASYQGAILIDPVDDGEEAHLLFLLTHEIKFGADQEQRALALAAATLVPEHFQEVADRRIAHVVKTLAAVHERLTKEISFWSDRWIKLKEDKEAGKDVRLNVENARRTVADLEGRLEGRKKELQSMRHVISATPVALGGALVVPVGLLRRLRGKMSANAVATCCTDAATHSRIELIAMDAVRQAEEARGCTVVDVSAIKCGWDLTSYSPAIDGKQPDCAILKFVIRLVYGVD